MKHKQVIYGEYVFTPCKNAFNNKTSYWVSKNGYTFAIYAFTPIDQRDLTEQLSKDSMDLYCKLYEERLRRLNMNREKG